MKRSAKKALSLFLCAMLCMSLLPAAAFAENETAETEPVTAELAENAGLLPEEPAAKAPAPAEETSGTRAEPESAAEPEETGADKVLTAVHSGEGAALAQEENGDYTITSFAELKALLAEGLTGYTDIFYVGTESFVFEEDLTLPENVVLHTKVDTIVPSGVTVTSNEMLDVWGGTLYVEGTLVAKDNINLQNIDVSGSLQSYGTICIPNTGTISGEEKIIFFLGEYGMGEFGIQYDVDSAEAVIAALQEADTNKPNRFYCITLSSDTTVIIDEEITIGDNALLFITTQVVIAENGKLNIVSSSDGLEDVYITADLFINGELYNLGDIVVDCYLGGKLTLRETGLYSGSGTIFAGGDTLGAPDEALPGFDLTAFDVTGSAEEGWILTLKTEEETVPGDVNGDGKVNTMDLIRLMKHINGEEVEMAEGAGDVNGDGKINTMDLIRLMKYINGEVI